VKAIATMKAAKLRRRPKPNLDTYRELQEVAAYRQQHIKAKGCAPSLTKVCQLIRIDPRTLKQYAPELVEKWKDPGFLG
jgi:hypothetical protein